MRGNREYLRNRQPAPGSIPACAGEPSIQIAGDLQSSVYPRVCGGTVEDVQAGDTYVGLSPRVRGNRWTTSCGWPCPRSIPACAGEPARYLDENNEEQVYPRVCGGTRCGTCRKPCRSGLSPRVRGNRGRGPDQPGGRRSIPACAGEPVVDANYWYQDAVYPRVCGGTAHHLVGGHVPQGLSPRVRGNRSGLTKLCPLPRSIPACAGEPPPVSGLRRKNRVYPRVCGGTPIFGLLIGRRRGLSPRVRGNPQPEAPAGRQGRSIPACAGEPPDDLDACLLTTVYPRVCGGTARQSLAGYLWRGLSPRVRGNPASALATATPRRSIPACAGEPRPALAPAQSAGVYPRVCGGTELPPVIGICGQGLSPRVRGNRHRRIFAGGEGGSIPACAGEPRSELSS